MGFVRPHDELVQTRLGDDSDWSPAPRFPKKNPIHFENFTVAQLGEVVGEDVGSDEPKLVVLLNDTNRKGGIQTDEVAGDPVLEEVGLGGLSERITSLHRPDSAYSFDQ